MNVLKADTGNFNKLLASVGLILVALVVVAPWLFLRETSVLQIKEPDLAAYTERGREVLRERQDRVAQIQSAMPWAMLVLLSAGTVLIIFGAKGMKELQPWETMEARARAQQAEASIQPQTEEDREASVRDAALIEAAPEVERESLAARESPAQPSRGESAATPSVPPVSHGEWMPRVAEIERAILDRLAHHPWGNYEFAPQMKVTTRERTALLIDALLRARDQQAPDVLIEIKLLRSLRSQALVQQVADRVISSVYRYERTTGRRAVPWLIIAVDDIDDEALRRAQQRLTARLIDGTATVGPADQLDWIDRVNWWGHA